MKPMQKIVPPIYFLATLIAMVILHRYAPLARIISPPLTWVGIVPCLLGIAITVGAARSFADAGTPLRPFEESKALVTDGLFRVSRNPMYLGMITTLIGVAILLGTVAPFLPLPIFFFILQHCFVKPEEEFLERQFGEPYREYRSRVRRWM